MTATPDRWAGLSHAELEAIYRRDKPTMTSEESGALWAAICRARDRELPPLSPAQAAELRQRLRGTTFDDPGWAPKVIAHGFPSQPQDRVRVLLPDGEQVVLVVRGVHRGGDVASRYYQLQSPDDPTRSWFLARNDQEPRWDRGLEVARESVPAVGWTAESTTPPNEFVPPPGPAPLHLHVRPKRVDDTGEELGG